jgi:hypothetical protein
MVSTREQNRLDPDLGDDHTGFTITNEDEQKESNFKVNRKSRDFDRS